MDARYDVAVVGGGLLGLAAARALARRDRQVVLLERDKVGSVDGGSKGSCRIFRLGYTDPAYVALARRAREFWGPLEEECGQRLLRPTPQLTFGGDLATVHQAMRSAGAPGLLLAADAAAARFPQVTADGPALLETESCVISADATLQALAAGVPEIQTGVTVTGLSDDGREVAITTTAGPVTAGTVIVCAGPWTAELLATGGIAVPSAATLEQIGYVAPAAEPAPEMPIFICHDAQIPYGLPVPGSSLYKIGFHHSGPPADPGRQDHAPDPDLCTRLGGLARRHLPGFSPGLIETERCIYDNSPDEGFIVDRAGRVVIGSGTSGHGFKFGPLLGEWLADLATGRDLADDDAGLLARLSLRRFAG
jgi:sarcosine oxidase